MARAVRATGKDSDGDITKLCGSWGSTPKLTAVSDIDAAKAAGRPSPYTSGGQEVLAIRDNSVKDGVYLRTAPGGGTANNLNNLPDC